jgi:hypothetical protein
MVQFIGLDYQVPLCELKPSEAMTGNEIYSNVTYIVNYGESLMF